MKNIDTAKLTKSEYFLLKPLKNFIYNINPRLFFAFNLNNMKEKYIIKRLIN